MSCLPKPAPPTAHESQFEREAVPWLESVYRYAFSMTRDRADAEDVVQETYLRAHTLWHNYVPGTDCRRWLFAICRNVFLRSRERKRVTAELSLVTDREPDTAAAPGLPHWPRRPEPTDASVTRADLAAAIERALRRLPAAFRAALVLVDVEGESYEAASAILRVPVGTLRSRVFRGRRQMKALLSAHARDLGVTAR